MIPTFLRNWYTPNHTGRAVPIDPLEIVATNCTSEYIDPLAPACIDPLETAAATLAKHGAELRRQARVAKKAAFHDTMRAMQGDPALRPALADVKAELAPLFERLDMREASRGN